MQIHCCQANRITSIVTVSTNPHVHMQTRVVGINGTRWCSWVRHCATRREVAGSIPDVSGIYWLNPSGRTMVLGSTHILTETSTRNISWGQRRPVRKADNLTTFMCRLSWNLGASASWSPQGLSRPGMGLLFISRTKFYCILIRLQNHKILIWACFTSLKQKLHLNNT